MLAGLKADLLNSQRREHLCLCLLMAKTPWGQPLQVGPTLQEAPGLRHFPAQQPWNEPSFARDVAKSHPWRWKLPRGCREHSEESLGSVSHLRDEMRR